MTSHRCRELGTDLRLVEGVFLGWAVVKSLPSNVGGIGSIPET